MSETPCEITLKALDESAEFFRRLLANPNLHLDQRVELHHVIGDLENARHVLMQRFCTWKSEESE